MKRLVAGILLLFIVGLFAASADESKMFVVTKMISKIYTHRLGFKVVFLKNDLSQGEFYVPMRWFDDAGGKGMLIKGKEPVFPFFSIFWYEGEFHHIKLYAQANLAHETWGSLEHKPGIESNFDIETIELKLN